MSTSVHLLVGVRVDAPKIAKKSLRCIVCRRGIPKGERYWESGTTNAVGRVEYVVNVHRQCLGVAKQSRS